MKKREDNNQLPSLVIVAKSLITDLEKIPGFAFVKENKTMFDIGGGSYSGLRIALDNSQFNSYRAIVFIKITVKTNFNNLFSAIENRLKFAALKRYQIVINRVDIICTKIQL